MACHGEQEYPISAMATFVDPKTGNYLDVSRVTSEDNQKVLDYLKKKIKELLGLDPQIKPVKNDKGETIEHLFYLPKPSTKSE